MTGFDPDVNTDTDWEEWGRRDPYFAVLTDPKFRRSNITESAKTEFFQSGAWQVNHVIDSIRRYIDAEFRPEHVLEFGCGVGRLLVPFAAFAKQVVGLDVSPSMLIEARRNCDACGAENVQLLQSDDALSELSSRFDLIHSSIVFQHIPVERGQLIFSNLLQHMNPGGVAAIQLTYSKTIFAATQGIAPVHVSMPRAKKEIALPVNEPSSDPAIQMNPYNMNSILFFMQQNGVTRFYADFTDHGGELGLYLFFKRP